MSDSRTEAIGLLREALELAEREEAEGAPIAEHATTFQRLVFHPKAVSLEAAAVTQDYLNRVSAARQKSLLTV